MTFLSPLPIPIDFMLYSAGPLESTIMLSSYMIGALDRGSNIACKLQEWQCSTSLFLSSHHIIHIYSYMPYSNVLKALSHVTEMLLRVKYEK